jgi:tRNA nucleotidyltransferase (CCA-adding enzyme)
MQVVAWSDWLDRHIPYYEKTKQINRYADNPPSAILVVDPVDRNRRVAHAGFAWSTWEAMDNSIRNLNYLAEPVFLDNDTHQRWYWAFWDRDEALMAVIRLS